MALGADRGDVLWLVLKRALALVVCGLGAGLACAWFATRLLSSFLFGVRQHDPFTVLTVSLLLLVSGLVAAFIPARRAASIDPMQALRTE
jgi:ABC-type antimicrobial peptide transport system permease subunit